MDWSKIYEVTELIKSRPKWMDKIKKNYHEFFKIFPAACREVKAKLNEDERYEVYHRIDKEI